MICAYDLNPYRNDKSGICELCNKHFDQLAIDSMKNIYDEAEDTDQATIKGPNLCDHLYF